MAALIKQKFGGRDLDSLTEQCLRQMYKELPFDMNLIASNDEKIPVHYFAMILFSSYFRNKFKGELNFKPNIDVPLKKFSHEILEEIVKFIYFGETWIDSNKTTEFVEVLHFLELLYISCGPLVACIGSEAEEDDVSEGYVEFSRDPASIAIHEHETMFWDCEFSGCTSKTVTKVVNGIIMIKRIQPLHSTDCSKAQAERNSSKPENEVNPGDSKILTLNNGLAKDDGLLSDWSSDDLYDSSSSEGDDESESDLFEGWSTVDDETDDQTENNDENFNQIKKSGPSAICDDDSDSLVEVCSPKAPIDQKCVRR